jgi:hypothetical protein
MAKFELTCTTNSQLELRSILDEEAHKKDERRQKMLEDMSGVEETKEVSKDIKIEKANSIEDESTFDDQAS